MSKFNNNIEFIIKTQNSKVSQESIVHNKNSRRNKIKLTSAEYNDLIIIWSLSQFQRQMHYDGIEWQYQSSRNKLNNGLLAENILTLLNSEIIFENYLPKENDFLKIWLEYKHTKNHNKSRPYIGDFISFIYNKEWKINNGFDHINFEYEILQEGEIKIY
ncbi:hypothetical protein BA768_07530 [Chryseobacterium sp. CBo1]|uniref:hypothetical protein n=1 Tax=Chryseobacterium sp. CBo1 TaxID=1869230 RepID=UPI00081055B2|nr:hypothetical protein [Chryseobacterium sp. CBo1]OCK49740.1 hypothetical protein BA768_07530 [Chryseobacterium sp. CBo1]